jgi:hypothetical protein
MIEDEPTNVSSARRRAGPKQTKQEADTQLMRERLMQHIEEWYPGYRHTAPPGLAFIAVDGKVELWECALIPPKAEGTERETVWLLWNAKEVVSHSSYNAAFTDFVTELKGKRIEGKLQYYTSPLAVSAALAILMLALISGLLLWRGEAPNQLWSVFTAVVAFYFGRESGTRSIEIGGKE